MSFSVGSLCLALLVLVVPALAVPPTYATQVEAMTAEPMQVSEVSVWPGTFYPYVRDGYRDTTVMDYYLNQGADVVGTVRNSDGRTVRRIDLGWRGAGYRSLTWNGRNNSGDLVAVGYYSIQVQATNTEGSRATVTRQVRVNTGYRTMETTKRRWGNDGNPATRGTCYVTRYSYDDYAELDCWGGRYARMTYNFSLPGNAYDVSWRVRGARSSADICCDGRISRTGRRMSSTLFRVRTEVTGWRAFEVYSASVTYKWRKRV
jgi:hypothetical protein